MTAPAAANSALASLALATATGVAAGSVAVRPGEPGVAPAGAAPATAFSALLLGLRAPAAALPATPGDAVSATDTAIGAALPGLPPAPPAAPADAAAEPGQSPEAPAGTVLADGTTLPADGTSLPPADLATLRATLEAVPAAPVGTAPQPPPGPALGGPVAPPAPPNPPPVARARNATPGPVPAMAAWTRAGDAPAGAPAGATAGAPSGEPSVPTDGAGSHDAARAPEPTPDAAATADFRARLAALLAPADRAALPTDSGTASLAATAGAFGTAASATPATVAMAATATATAADPLLDTLPALEPLGDGEAFSRGMGERLLLLADRGLQSATVRLQPEHLGPMEIRIRVDEDGSAQVHFSAQHAQTRDALEHAIPRLRELFADQGLSLSQANVDAGRGGFAQRAFGPETPPWLRWGGAGAAEPEPETPPSARRLARGAERRLDVLV